MKHEFTISDDDEAILIAAGVDIDKDAAQYFSEAVRRLNNIKLQSILSSQFPQLPIDKQSSLLADFATQIQAETDKAAGKS